MNPYAEIRKVPLLGDGISSSAYAVQMKKSKKINDVWIDKWSEVGVVGGSYMLLPNSEVRDAAHQVTSESKLDFREEKVFFNGKNFIYSMICDHVIGEISEGDDVALGIQFWNSYDGSRSFGFSLMLFRLVCLNGMVSKTNFIYERFKHEPQSENWDESLEKAVTSINRVLAGSLTLDNLLSNLRSLDKLYPNIDDLGDIRHNYLKDIPVSLWGNVVDRFISDKYDNKNGWSLLNSATDILWHKDKPTIASYDQNSHFVDGLCGYATANRIAA